MSAPVLAPVARSWLLAAHLSGDRQCVLRRLWEALIRHRLLSPIPLHDSSLHAFDKFSQF